MVLIEDLGLLEDIEDCLDLEGLERALADPENKERIPWGRVKTELGLSVDLYNIEILPAAKKELASLPREIQKRIRQKIESLKVNPHPHGVKTQQGKRGMTFTVYELASIASYMKFDTRSF